MKGLEVPKAPCAFHKKKRMKDESKKTRGYNIVEGVTRVIMLQNLMDTKIRGVMGTQNLVQILKNAMTQRTQIVFIL